MPVAGSLEAADASHTMELVGADSYPVSHVTSHWVPACSTTCCEVESSVQGLPPVPSATTPAPKAMPAHITGKHVLVPVLSVSLVMAVVPFVVA